jgi:hypothetical protein
LEERKGKENEKKRKVRGLNECSKRPVLKHLFEPVIWPGIKYHTFSTESPIAQSILRVCQPVLKVMSLAVILTSIKITCLFFCK